VEMADLVEHLGVLAADTGESTMLCDQFRRECAGASAPRASAVAWLVPAWEGPLLVAGSTGSRSVVPTYLIAAEAPAWRLAWPHGLPELPVCVLMAATVPAVAEAFRLGAGVWSISPRR
jgi:hypothetical protein